MVYRRYKLWWHDSSSAKENTATIICDLDEETLRECLNYNVEIKDSSIYQGKIN